MDLGGYKGILLVGVVVAAILFFSKDLECVLLMTGIIVNIIAICLNTGATNFKLGGETPTEFLPVRRKDLINKYYDKHSKETFDPKPTKVIPKKYEGAIDTDDCKGRMYRETASDSIPYLSVKHQGINTKRQIAGAMRRRKVLVPYLAQELKDSEDKDWWGSKDE